MSLNIVPGGCRQREFLLASGQPFLADGTVTNEALHTHEHV